MSVMKLCAGACAMKNGSLAFSAALCGVTPQAQNTGTMPGGTGGTLTGTASVTDMAASLAADAKVILVDADTGERTVFSARFACPVSGFSIEEIEPRLFSFNAPSGACPACDGLGTELKFEPDLVVPDPTLSLAEGALVLHGPGHLGLEVREAIGERPVEGAPLAERARPRRDLDVLGHPGRHARHRDGRPLRVAAGPRPAARRDGR